ncbi:glutathione S-transferase N-terminal domain-containing protein [Pendulispora albinea]|uniref:Glutathione S-transferase N-terminal domain-containing protein n=1 Tax=Pendulispora albinea TaxID=2741071 RepID=A0ABZ2LNZ3_9BACT
MFDLHYWPTPNGHKITMFLEETGLPYRIFPVNINTGEQFNAEFLKIAPNNRMPAIVDHDPVESGPPVSIFESGAILLYLAEKTGQLFSPSLRGRVEVLQWLFWQVGGLGPMLGQNHHFVLYAPQKIPYAVDRYVNETSRLYAVLDKQLADREFIARTFSIADIACYPWIVPHQKQGQDLALYPNVKRWFDTIRARPSTVRAYEKAKSVQAQPAAMTEEARKILFGQNASTVRR